MAVELVDFKAVTVNMVIFGAIDLISEPVGLPDRFWRIGKLNRETSPDACGRQNFHYTIYHRRHDSGRILTLK